MSLIGRSQTNFFNEISLFYMLYYITETFNATIHCFSMIIFHLREWVYRNVKKKFIDTFIDLVFLLALPIYTVNRQ